MKFAIEHISATGGRIGVLSGLSYASHILHKTPCVVLTTEAGSVTNLTQDALEIVLKLFWEDVQKKNIGEENTLPLLNVTAQHFASRTDIIEKFDKGIAAFAGLPHHGVFATINCLLKQSRTGYNDRNSVSVWTNNGRFSLVPESYMKFVQFSGCSLYEVLYDGDTPRNCTLKRISKSCANSVNHLNACLQTASSVKAGVLLPLLGGLDTGQRGRWAVKMAEKQKCEQHPRVAGYTLAGLHIGGASAEDIEPELLGDCVSASLSKVDRSLLVAAMGSFSPVNVLELVSQGVDIFDTSLPARAAYRHSALVFNYTPEMKRQRKDEISPKNYVSGSPIGETLTSFHTHSRKKRKSVTGDPIHTVGDDVTLPEKNDSDFPAYEINLLDAMHSSCTEPLLPECGCYTCSRGYSRSYIHHLCRTKEMLAPVLLTMHNLHHWFGFFSSIRLAVKSDALPELREIVESTSVKCSTKSSAGNDLNGEPTKDNDSTSFQPSDR